MTPVAVPAPILYAGVAKWVALLLVIALGWKGGPIFPLMFISGALAVAAGETFGVDGLALAQFPRKELEVSFGDTGSNGMVFNTTGAVTLRGGAWQGLSSALLLRCFCRCYFKAG